MSFDGQIQNLDIDSACGGPDVCCDDLCRGEDEGICGLPSLRVLGLDQPDDEYPESDPLDEEDELRDWAASLRQNVRNGVTAGFTVSSQAELADLLERVADRIAAPAPSTPAPTEETNR